MALDLEELQNKLNTAEKTIEKLQKRLQAVEDEEEIKRMHYDYMNCVQKGEFDSIEDYFTENAIIEAGATTTGRSAIGKRFREQMSISHTGKEGSVLIHPIIRVDGDKAIGTWQLFFMYSHPITWQSLYWVQGFYDIRYERENGLWKIAYLKHVARLKPPNFKPPVDEDLIHFLDK